MAEMEIRPITPADIDQVLALWQRGGVGVGADADRQEITTMIDFGAPYFLLMFEADDLVASVMGTYDGHRGRIKRCVVDPAHRGSGVGRALIDALEARFAADGITELRLEVWAHNTGGLAFWQRTGWTLLDDIRYFERSVTKES